MEGEYSDGDSFHVKAAGKDQIFRLYAVDAPETHDDFPERVKEQQPRFFARITLADGSDLGMRLIEAGLARSYGMREDVSAAYLHKLDRAQEKAEKEGTELWAAKAKKAATTPSKKRKKD